MGFFNVGNLETYYKHVTTYEVLSAVSKSKLELNSKKVELVMHKYFRL